MADMCEAHFSLRPPSVSPEGRFCVFCGKIAGREGINPRPPQMRLRRHRWTQIDEPPLTEWKDLCHPCPPQAVSVPSW